MTDHHPSPDPNPAKAIRRTLVEIPQEDEEGESPPAAPAKPAASGKPPSSRAADAAPFRPVHRPPMAVLQVLDDSQKSAECVRVRGDSFIIGRSEGDLLIPHDSLVSSRHAEIVRLQQGDHFRWYLRDLQSTNGTFVRAAKATLKDNQEVMVARRRFRFTVGSEESPEADEEGDGWGSGNVRQTINWSSDDPAEAMKHRPCLIELVHGNEARRFPITKDVEWIGRDPRQCGVAVPEENTINPRHASVFRDSQGRWHIEDSGSVNGVWIRITECPLSSPGSFLVGEQVCVFVLP